MSRYAREHPDEPDYPVDEVLDRAAERAIARKVIARADAAEAMTPADHRSDSERFQNEALERAEIESGSDVEPEGDE